MAVVENTVDFPEPDEATEDGLIGFGGNLEIPTLLQAYRTGIFPWPIEGYPLAWFSPPQRAVVFFDEFHISRSLQKFIKKSPYKVTVDQAFTKVIKSCAATHQKKHKGTWITSEMLSAYIKLHEAGYAKSFEVWEDNQLVGGLYGVDLGGVFAAESMFHLKPNTSKIALIACVETLRSRGLKWIDIQMLTPHLEAMGAREVDRKEFLKMLSENL